MSSVYDSVSDSMAVSGPHGEVFEGPVTVHAKYVDPGDTDFENGAPCFVMSSSQSLPDIESSLGTHVGFFRATSIDVCDHEALSKLQTLSHYGSSEDCQINNVMCMPLCRILSRNIDKKPQKSGGGLKNKVLFGKKGKLKLQRSEQIQNNIDDSDKVIKTITISNSSSPADAPAGIGSTSKVADAEEISREEATAEEQAQTSSASKGDIKKTEEPDLQYADDSSKHSESADEYDAESDIDSDILTESAPLSYAYLGMLQKDVCQICYEEKSLHLRYCCKGAFCDSCLNAFCKFQLDQGSIRFACPNIDCDKPIYQEEVFARLDSENKTKLYRFLVNANTDPCKKTCPRCSEVFTLENLSDLGNKKVKARGLKVSCDQCGLDWCFPCHAPWHQAISCREYRKGDKLLKSWAKQTYTVGVVNARQCPKCKIYIQRSSGCNHMTCSHCGVSFCYLCGERYRTIRFIGNHFSRWGILGCRYQLFPNRPWLRRLIRGTIFGAELLVLPVAGALVVVAGAVVAAGAIVASPVLVTLLVRRWRQKRRRQKAMKELMEHDRRRRERIRNTGCPYMENYNHMKTMGVEKLWEMSDRQNFAGQRSDDIAVI